MVTTVLQLGQRACRPAVPSGVRMVVWQLGQRNWIDMDNQIVRGLKLLVSNRSTLFHFPQEFYRGRLDMLPEGRPLDRRFRQPFGDWIWQFLECADAWHSSRRLDQFEWRVGEILVVETAAREDVRRVSEVIEHRQRGTVRGAHGALQHSADPAWHSRPAAALVDLQCVRQSADTTGFDVDVAA